MDGQGGLGAIGVVSIHRGEEKGDLSEAVAREQNLAAGEHCDRRWGDRCGVRERWARVGLAASWIEALSASSSLMGE